MSTKVMRVVSAIGALALSLAAVPMLQAQCGTPTRQIKPASWQPQFGGLHPFLAGAKTEDSAAGEASIVGMWHVIFTANTINGAAIPPTVIDNALVVWHADGTEIMNSVRPPQDGNFCMGVWEKKSAFTYSLNHFAWFANTFPNNTNNGIGDPSGPTRITEYVTMTPAGDRYSGAFTLHAYDTSGKTTTVFTGVITGARITVDTTAGDLL